MGALCRPDASGMPGIMGVANSAVGKTSESKDFMSKLAMRLVVNLDHLVVLVPTLNLVPLDPTLNRYMV